MTFHEVLENRSQSSDPLSPNHTQVLAIWMMSPWQALILGPGSPQLGWSPARVPWDTEGSFVRCASRVTEEKRRASARTVPVCSAPAMGTARPATLSQVRGRPLGTARPKLSSAGGSETPAVLFAWTLACLLTPSLQIGVCNCRDNTAGPNCEKCSDGYYGDSTAGTSLDCQPCPCPGGSSCAVVPKTQEVVCTNCPTGTTGESALPTGALGKEELWKFLGFSGLVP